MSSTEGGMRPAGDERTRLILQKQYRSIGCFYCKSDAHTYQNCPARPCYLCKKQGHVSSLCPYRHGGSTSTSFMSTSVPPHPFKFTRLRELTSNHTPLAQVPMYQMFRNARVMYHAEKVHPSRVVSAEWAPDAGAILSGDKKGEIRIWPISTSVISSDGVIDTHLLKQSQPSLLHPHRCNVNAFAFNQFDKNVVYSTSGDGVVCQSQIDYASSPSSSSSSSSSYQDKGSEILLDLNPGGWVSASLWRMSHGIAYDHNRHNLYVGATDGTIARIDPRTATGEEALSTSSRARFHEDKVTSLHINPHCSNLIASASNDTRVCLWDARKFIPGTALGTFTHDRIATSAYFSPLSGSKLLTTSFDNRIRMWHDIHAFQGDVNAFVDSQPSMTIVHSHDFHRYLSPFRAVWNPLDYAEDTFMCGRFLGSAFTDPLDPDGEDTFLLKPVDIFSARKAAPVVSLVDRSLQLICTINRFCPIAPVVLTAASSGIYLWGFPSRMHRRRSASSAGRDGLVQRGDGEGDDDDDDDDDDGGGGGDNSRVGGKRRGRGRGRGAPPAKRTKLKTILRCKGPR